MILKIIDTSNFEYKYRKHEMNSYRTHIKFWIDLLFITTITKLLTENKNNSNPAWKYIFGTEFDDHVKT